MKFLGAASLAVALVAGSTAWSQTNRPFVIFELQPPPPRPAATLNNLEVRLQVRQDDNTRSSLQPVEFDAKSKKDVNHPFDAYKILPNPGLKAEVVVSADAAFRPLPLDAVRTTGTVNPIARVAVIFRPAPEVFSDQRRRVEDISRKMSQSVDGKDISQLATEAFVYLSDMLAFAEVRKDKPTWKVFYVAALRAMCSFSKSISFDAWPSDVQDSIFGLDGNLADFGLLKDRVTCIQQTLQSTLAKGLPSNVSKKLVEAITQSPFDISDLLVDQQIDLLDAQLFALLRLGEIAQGIDLFKLLQSRLVELYSDPASPAIRRQKIQRIAQRAVELLMKFANDSYPQWNLREGVAQIAALKEINELLKPFSKAI